VLELHAIASKKEEKDGRFAITMTSIENIRFLKGIKEDHKLYYSMIGRVNAETSDCSRAEDRESIHECIRRTVGFAKLNRMVFTILEGWMEDRLKFQIKANEAAGNKRVMMEWNSILALVLTDQGRHDEARLIHEDNLKTLEFTQHGLSLASEESGATSWRVFV
jgi:hypothetical protein